MVLIDGEEIQCNHTIRNTKNPKPHICYAKKAPNKGYKKLLQSILEDKWQQLQYHEVIQ